MDKYISVFYNLNSGKTNFHNKLLEIEEVLTSLGFESSFYNYLNLDDEINDILLKLKDENKYKILLCGGDGTYHYFVNDLMKNNVSDFFELSLFPLGTSNDLASYFKFKKAVKSLKSSIANYTTKAIDVYKLNDEYFIYAAAVGKFSLASYGVKRKHVKRFGYLAYMFAALKDLFKRKKYTYRLKYDGNIINGTASLIVLAGISRVASINFSKKLNILPDDGLINAIIFKRRHFLSWFNIILFYLLKGRSKLGVKKISFNEANLIIDPKDTWNVDGEGINLENELIIKVFSNKIKINVPNNIR